MSTKRRIRRKASEDIRIAVGSDKGHVYLSFQEKVAWVGMPPAQARELAAMIAHHANTAEGAAR